MIPMDLEHLKDSDPKLHAFYTIYYHDHPKQITCTLQAYLKGGRSDRKWLGIELKDCTITPCIYVMGMSCSLTSPMMLDVKKYSTDSVMITEEKLLILFGEQFFSVPRAVGDRETYTVTDITANLPDDGAYNNNPDFLKLLKEKDITGMYNMHRRSYTKSTFDYHRRLRDKLSAKTINKAAKIAGYTGLGKGADVRKQKLFEKLMEDSRYTNQRLYDLDNNNLIEKLTLNALDMIAGL